MYVVRPVQGGPHGPGTVEVVVTRGNKHRAGDGGQGAPQGLGGLPKDPLRVQQVAGQKHQVGSLLPGQGGQVLQQLPLLPPALGGPLRGQAGKGAVQVEVSPVDYLQHSGSSLSERTQHIRASPSPEGLSVCSSSTVKPSLR